jgi:aspartyl-tRNA(Asn)/glutamyl-tRNA(Gln) amidotransferase subunit A
MPEASPDLAWGSVVDTARALRGGSLTSVEVVEASLTRIADLDTALNSFLTPMSDQARRNAAEADEELARGANPSPLLGLPVGIKDAIDVGGVRCTFGSRILEGRLATEDAAVVAALRKAGAVVVGKQNLHEFAYGITGENPHYGDVANPWDPARITGGSSAGTAAAIAAGLVGLGVGTDTGGSVRIPAAMCGVVGLKPTYGLVSRAGVLPLAWSLDHVGPLARTVLDCFHLLDAMVEPDHPARPAAPGRYARAVRLEADAGLRGTRIGVPRHVSDDVEPGVAGAVRDATRVLEGLGACLVEVDLPHAVHAQAAAVPVMGAEAAAWHGRWLDERSAEYGVDVLERLRQGARTVAVDYLDGQRVRTVLQREFEAAFASVDVVVGPTVPIVAPRRGETQTPGPSGVAPRAVINRLTVLANMTGFPALSVPCGLVDGLPVGLQAMGPAQGEVTIGAVALAFERAGAWATDRPALAI